MNSWHCLMCNVSLEEAIKQQFNVLKLTPDQLIDDYDRMVKQYTWERTCKRPKKTCSKSCGSNYTSWLRTQEPKRSYVREDFKCDCCGKLSHGGRMIPNHVREFRICRDCHRKKLTHELRRMWEVFNKEHRVEYQRDWRHRHPKKMSLYKKHYRERVKKNEPRLGKTRKIVCEANPTLFIL